MKILTCVVLAFAIGTAACKTSHLSESRFLRKYSAKTAAFTELNITKKVPYSNVYANRHLFKQAMISESKSLLKNHVGQIRSNSSLLHSKGTEVKLKQPHFSKIISSYLSTNYLATTVIESTGTIAFLLFHMLVLCKNCIALPFQIIPCASGLSCSIGLENIVGMLSLWMLVSSKSGCNLRQSIILRNSKNIVDIMSPQKLPWSIKGEKSLKIKAVAVVAGLGFLYWLAGVSTPLVDWVLAELSAIGIPITNSMQIGLKVLLSHLVWVGSGITLLGLTKWYTFHLKIPPFVTSNWLSASTQPGWSIPVTLGYACSAFLFQLADIINQLLLPSSLFSQSNDDLMEQLTNSEVVL
eukprot:GHVL01018370.1.p1 GENE.GHVL01018370.1~~GHVL01018370.1.p1  ORF type:complete len:353 (+),score=22.41 GHVL01018370.1:32-1090(+)